MSTQPSAAPPATKPARGCPAARKTAREEKKKAACLLMPTINDIQQLEKNPEIGKCIKISSNNRVLKGPIEAKGYEFQFTKSFGMRTASWLVFKYTGTTASEPAPAAQALP